MPDPEAKQHALEDFARYVNPQKVRILRAAGLDIIEAYREGPWVWDLDGRRFLDCFTSAGSFNLGRRHPLVVAAMHEAVDRLDHGNFMLCSREKADLARKLAEIAPGDLSCVAFGTGGGEIIDFALKLCRGATRRTKVVSTVNGYHGHTGFALSAAGRKAYRAPFEPLMADFVQVPYGDLPAAEAAIDSETACVLVEPVQGEGGVVVPPVTYLPGLRSACDAAGAMLVVDEIQTGFGRLGTWFACEHFGVVPDVITLAKSLGGSLVAISAAVFTEDLREFLIPNPFIHLSTFGGSDLACAVALAAISVMEEEGLVEHSASMGRILQEGLASIAADYPDVVAEVRGIGMMAGLKFGEDSMGARMSAALVRQGVLAIYSANEPTVMRLMPSLVVGPEEIELLLRAIRGALDEVVDGATAPRPGTVDSATASGGSTGRPARPRRRPPRVGA